MTSIRRAVVFFVGVLLASLVVGIGCNTGAVQNGFASCATDLDCPSDFHCATTFTCWRNGTDPAGDASVAPCKTTCGITCVDTASDRAHCGGCDKKCADGEVCSQGACALSCGGGTSLCREGCRDLKTDPTNCGACGTACGAGRACVKGECVSGCLDGLTTCSGPGADGGSLYCANIQTDNSNCGACGKVCGPGLACKSGVCSTTCGGGDTLCPGPTGGDASGVAFCSNLKTDRRNCGTCGVECTPGLLCSNGTCAVSCQANLVECGGTCVDPNSSRAFCGATPGCGANGGSAGTACADGNVCANGVCRVSCPGTQINCGGTCIDPQTSRTQCGATGACGAGGNGSAGTACAAGNVCANGVCTVSCPGTQINCGGTCIEPATSRNYCGATGACGAGGGSAGVACAPGNVCANGTCQVSCPGGQINCGGVCTDPLTSRGFCGATGACGAGGGSAGTACAAGSVCANGTCQVSCPGLQINCGGVCVDPLTSRSNCGATGACGAGGNGTPGAVCGGGNVCAGGSCQVSCPGSQVNCGGVCVDPLTSRSNCGATGACGAGGNGTPGTACAVGNVCSGGTCQVSCPGGQINCGGICVDPTTSAANCGATGACGAGGNGSPGAVCGAGKVCTAGVCQASCQAPLIACSGSCVDPRFDPGHCNGCAPCPAVPNATNFCANSACGIASCAPDFLNCNGTVADGCEVNRLTDNNNCGGCGVVCSGGTPVCAGGVCIAVPQPTFLWLDATDPTTITKDAGNNVSQWRDKSGLNRHANQGATAPVWNGAGGPNGNPAILFNGATVRMATAPVPTSSDMTIFVVFNMISPMNWGSLINQAHDTYFSIRKSDCCGGNGNLNFHIQNNNGAPLQPITLNSWRIVTAMRQGSTSTFYYVGGPVTTHNGDTLLGGQNVPITIGNAQVVGESMGGFIAEIRAFSSALTAGQRNAVETNLKSKFGL